MNVCEYDSSLPVAFVGMEARSRSSAGLGKEEIVAEVVLSLFDTHITYIHIYSHHRYIFYESTS
jgi:hypothetical protein